MVCIDQANLILHVQDVFFVTTTSVADLGKGKG